MKSNSTEYREIVQQVETLQCDQCRKRWQVGWVEAVEGESVEHAITCDCGRVLKVVQAAGDDPPLMILQHSHWKTIAACLPAFAAGALFPILSDTVILTAYILLWIGCAATFVNEDTRSISALGSIAIWSLAIISFAAAVGALAGHAFWWWWQ
jgi:hypothetical protein